MAMIRVILAGRPATALYDTYDYPVVLQFGDQTSYSSAVWVVPSFPGRIPAGRLSEIRVEQGPLTVLIDGPEGFRSGPHNADWVRGFYPRGKDCSFIRFNVDARKSTGVSLRTFEGSLIVDDLSLGGEAPQAAEGGERA